MRTVAVIFSLFSLAIMSCGPVSQDSGPLDEGIVRQSTPQGAPTGVQTGTLTTQPTTTTPTQPTTTTTPTPTPTTSQPTTSCAQTSGTVIARVERAGAVCAGSQSPIIKLFVNGNEVGRPVTGTCGLTVAFFDFDFGIFNAGQVNSFRGDWWGQTANRITIWMKPRSQMTVSNYDIQISGNSSALVPDCYNP